MFNALNKKMHPTSFEKKTSSFHILSNEQIVDILTKFHKKMKFQDFKNKIRVTYITNHIKIKKESWINNSKCHDYNTCKV